MKSKNEHIKKHASFKELMLAIRMRSVSFIKKNIVIAANKKQIKDDVLLTK